MPVGRVDQVPIHVAEVEAVAVDPHRDRFAPMVDLERFVPAQSPGPRSICCRRVGDNRPRLLRRNLPRFRPGLHGQLKRSLTTVAEQEPRYSPGGHSPHPFLPPRTIPPSAAGPTGPRSPGPGYFVDRVIKQTCSDQAPLKDRCRCTDGCELNTPASVFAPGRQPVPGAGATGPPRLRRRFMAPRVTAASWNSPCAASY